MGAALLHPPYGIRTIADLSGAETISAAHLAEDDDIAGRMTKTSGFTSAN